MSTSDSIWQFCNALSASRAGTVFDVEGLSHAVAT